MLNSPKFSYWERKHFFTECDLIVVGAGIVGYSTSLHYKQQFPDAKILILERGLLPSGSSTKNAGFACFGSPTELYDDLKRFDKDVVWDTVAKRLEGLNYLQEIVGTEALSLKVNGSWDLIRESELDVKNEILDILPEFNENLKRVSGQDNVYSWDENTSSKFGFKGILGGFNNRLEGQIDTSKMNAAYYAKIIENDIRVLFGIEALGIDSDENGCTTKTSIGDIKSDKVAICTNGFAKQFLPKDDIAPARAQVVITKPIENLPIKGTFHYQMGYYYFRNIDNRVLFGGGRNLDFKGETTTNISTSELVISKLKELLDAVILPDTPYEIEHSWAGVMGVGDTKKPIIKEIQPNVYCGVRLGGMGVAIGSQVGKELTVIMN